MMIRMNPSNDHETHASFESHRITTISDPKPHESTGLNDLKPFERLKTILSSVNKLEGLVQNMWQTRISLHV